MKTINKRICYGFYKNHNDDWCLGKDALNVAKIFIHYLNGKSIRDITLLNLFISLYTRNRK